jgi:hypothetical protein
MEVSGIYDIATSREDVWDAINDPDILRQCIPGCEGITVLPNHEWDVVALVKVGPIKARFNGRLSFCDIDPPNGCIITGSGNGGVTGFAKGRAEVRLEDAGAGTRLSYAVRSEVGGRIAQIGSRLLESSARKLIDHFFVRFTDILTNSPAEMAPEQAILASETSATVTTPASLDRTLARTSQGSVAGAAEVPRLQLILNLAILFGVAACLFGISTCIALLLLLLHRGL